MATQVLSKAPKITFYSSDICPYAQRTWLALEEAKANYKLKEIDLSNKSKEFLAVSSTGKVPTVIVEEPENGHKGILIESLITTQFVADAFPESNLNPKDPLTKAQSLLWADRFSETVGTVFSTIRKPEVKDWSDKQKTDVFINAIDKAIPYLVDPAPFVGNRSHPAIGDLIVAPFILRLYLLLSTDSLPKEIKEKLSEPQYKAWNDYVDAISNLPSVKKTFKPEKVLALFKKLGFA